MQQEVKAMAEIKEKFQGAKPICPKCNKSDFEIVMLRAEHGTTYSALGPYPTKAYQALVVYCSKCGHIIGVV